MKASLLLRDDQKPLLRAKVPISIVGLPFLSGLSAGDPRDLRFDLSTAFDSGPSLRVSYRPNLPSSPFSLVLKTGVGALGSPVSAPMSVSAEFCLLGKGAPAFFLHLKPRFGDFGLVKTVSSKGGKEVVKENGFVPEMVQSMRGVDGLLSGIEINARTVLPVQNRAAVKLRWGVRLPPELPSGFVGEELVGVGKRSIASWNSSPYQQLPVLVMRKLSIERIVPEREKKENERKNEVEALRAEHGSLRNTVEELRREVLGWKGAFFSGKYDGSVATGESKGRGGESGGNRSNGGKGGVPANRMIGRPVSEEEELKKALMSATASSG